MAEFAVLSLALVPLFLSIPLLGKYLDMAHATEAAARYVAFEATVTHAASGWKTDADLGNEVRRRFFSSSDAPIKTGDVAGDYAAHRNPLWADHTGRPLLAEFSTDVTASSRRSEPSSLPAALLPGASGFDLATRNFHSGTVAVRPRTVPAFPPFDGLALEIRRHQTLLVDNWAASGPAEVSRRIEYGTLLVYPISPLRLLGDTVGQLPRLVLDPAMEAGKIQPELVPCDRLEDGC